MASWEDELAVLLRELGVTLEEPKTHLRPTQISEADHQQGEHPLRDKDTSKRQAQSATRIAKNAGKTILFFASGR